MKKLFVLLFMFVMPYVANAQFRFGYFSYESMLKSMPEYPVAQKNISDLRAKYDAEMKQSAEEFNARYEDFLEKQRDFVPSILRKRQSELQDMMDRNVAFKKAAERLIDEARKEAMAPIRSRLEEAVKSIGRSRGYAFVLNTDSDACPYIDPALGEDITEAVKAALNIPQQ